MTDPTRTQLLQALDELGRRFPSWRFGQLVENVAGWTDISPWDVEDDQLLAAVRHYLDQSLATVGDGQKPASPH